jgi:hypothetical protein
MANTKRSALIPNFIVDLTALHEYNSDNFVNYKVNERTSSQANKRRQRTSGQANKPTSHQALINKR